MDESRITNIEILAGEGKLEKLKDLLLPNPEAEEINIALGNAIAYSQIKTAQYLLSIGGNLSHNHFDGTYYAIHNNELVGLRLSIKNGVNVNSNNGLFLNTSIVTAYNTKDTTIMDWLLTNGANPTLINKDTWNTFKTDEIVSVLKRHTTQK